MPCQPVADAIELEFFQRVCVHGFGAASAAQAAYDSAIGLLAKSKAVVNSNPKLWVLG
jgi:hypothetical protein